MKQFQYLTLCLPNEGGEEILRRLGLDGWEVYHYKEYNGKEWMLKREVEPGYMPDYLEYYRKKLIEWI